MKLCCKIVNKRHTIDDNDTHDSHLAFKIFFDVSHSRSHTASLYFRLLPKMT